MGRHTVQRPMVCLALISAISFSFSGVRHAVHRCVLQNSEHANSRTLEREWEEGLWWLLLGMTNGNNGHRVQLIACHVCSNCVGSLQLLTVGTTAMTPPWSQKDGNLLMVTSMWRCLCLALLDSYCLSLALILSLALLLTLAQLRDDSTDFHCRANRIG